MTGAPATGEVIRDAVAALADRLDKDGKRRGALVRDGALADVARAFDLDTVDLDLLVVAAAPDLDARLALLLDGHVAVGRAFGLLGVDPWDGAARRRVAASGPLVRHGLVEVLQRDQPFPERRLRVADRVVSHLLGDDPLDDAVAPLLVTPVAADIDGADEIARAIIGGVRVCWVHQEAATAGASLAAAAIARAGGPILAIDLRRLASGGLAAVYVAAAREAALRGAGLVVSGVAVERDRAALAMVAKPPCPVVLVGDGPWDPAWSSTMPYVASAPETPFAARRSVWRDVLRRFDVDPSVSPDGLDTFRLVPEQIVSSAVAAATQAAGHGRPLTGDDLLAGARLQNAGRLDRVARRVEPKATFDTLVIRADRRDELESIIHRARNLELVRETWGMGGGGARRGRGITCLFAGTSGTGKTLAAEVIAHALGVDLYTIDLSQVVDKYIGETEKNLERIFVEAEGMNAVLFFDEADALFGKRSDVQSAHDRHANVEVAYLLQRMERFNGVAVLATNLRGNLDDAFTRRIDVICHFPDPDENEREALWRLHLPPTLPVEDDIDVPVLAKAVDISGGVIRNIAMSAAYAAAAEGSRVGMEHLVRATQRELRKLGRLVRAADFGPYAEIFEVVPSETGEGMEGAG